MSATDHSELLGAEPRARISALVDDHTREILNRRRRGSTIRRRGWLVRRLLAAADLLGLAAAVLLTEFTVTAATHSDTLAMRNEIVVLLATLPIWVVVAKLYGLYDRDEEQTDHSTADDFGRVFHMLTVCTWLFWVLSRLSGVVHPSTAKLVVFWSAAIALVSLSRAVARAIARRSVVYLQNTLIVGADEFGQLLATKLLAHPEYGLNLVGFVDWSPVPIRDEIDHLAHLGTPDDISEVVETLDVERVVIAFPDESADAIRELVSELRELGVQVDIVPRLLESLGPSVMWNSMEGIPLVGMPPRRLSPSSRLLKRCVDIGLSSLALVVLLPVLVLVAVAVWLESGRPILYRRRILGRAGVELDAFKFRTMKAEFCTGDQYGGPRAREALQRLLEDPERSLEFARHHKLTDDPRVTRLGRLLRRTSLDELPQLYNVLVGQMSIVGPRMITAEELERYGDDADELLSVRPGLTGYWQVNGRSSVDYRDRVRLDLAYISGWSLGLDFNIMLRTARVLLTARGAQ